MGHKKIAETIAEIERRFDVNAVRFGELRVWPLIRLALWQQLVHPELEIMGLANQACAKHSLISSVIEDVKKISRACKYPKGYMNKLCFHNGCLRKIVNNTQVDTVFFSRAEEHLNQIEGGFFNPFLDPLIDMIAEQHSYMKVEIDSDSGPRKRPRYKPTIFLNAIWYFVKNRINAGNGRSSRINKLENFSGLKKCVSGVRKGISINEEYFLNQVRVIKKYEGFFAEVLSIIRPKAVFLVCYYDLVRMALISACIRLQIKTVDVQHGKQGKYHGMFTHWTKVPEEGYELLPDFFWVWGEETKRNIQRWQPDGLRRNIPVVGGNLWLSQWINSNRYEEVPGKYDDFLKMVGKYNEVILYTTQPIANAFPDCLLEAMRMSPDSWIWLIRLHPRQRDKLVEIDKFLQGKGLDNYEIKISSEISLYSLLRKSDHHLTSWSSVCYEAIYFGVPTTIIHPNGATLYEEYIEKGIFSYAANGQELLMAIRRAGKKGPPTEDIPYIETDPKKALEAIEIILGA